jgi:hypothetical protein
VTSDIDFHRSSPRDVSRDFYVAARIGVFFVSAFAASLMLTACGVSGAPAGPSDAQSAQNGDANNGSEDMFDKKDAKFSLDVFLNSEGVTILGTSAYDPMTDGLPSVPSNTPDSLKWVIEGDDGTILGKGYVPDPRVTKNKDGEKRKAESATFQLDVPTDKGTLELFENNPTL